MLRTESRVVEDTLQVWDLDSAAYEIRILFVKPLKNNLSFEDGKYFGPLTLEGATPAVTR